MTNTRGKLVFLLPIGDESHRAERKSEHVFLPSLKGHLGFLGFLDSEAQWAPASKTKQPPSTRMETRAIRSFGLPKLV